MPSPSSPLHRRARLIGALGLIAFAGAAAPAGATQIDGSLQEITIADVPFVGLPATGGVDDYAIDVITVEGQSVWKLTTTSPVRAVGGTCARISGEANVAGPSEIHCRRGEQPDPNPVEFRLGDGNDRVVAAAGFPDRLRLTGQDGDDTLVGGDKNDTIVGGEGDNVLEGGAGDDNVQIGVPVRTQFAEIPDGTNTIKGGPGRDDLRGADGADAIDGGDGDDLLFGGRGVDRLDGEAGNDSVNGQEDAFSKRDLLFGGAGEDRFFADILDQTFARDGEPDRLQCSNVRFQSDPLALTEIDLQDRFEPGAFNVDCPNVLRAPDKESPSVRVAKTTARLSGRLVPVTLRCTTSTICSGDAFLKLKGSSREVRTRYGISPKGSRTVRLTLSRADAVRVTKSGIAARVTLREKGIKGLRTVTRQITVKR